jgi:23S rRNA (uracil1939-C5)-methyltransferase
MVTIESLDQEGRGVARADGKVIFVEGALPGEVVTYTSFRRKPKFEVANIGSLLHPSSQRVTPRCRYFGVCGGCSLQHLDPSAQVAVKQRKLEDDLWHIGRVRAETMLSPIYGQSWGYRHRARFTVRDVPKKGGVLVGFHEKRSSFVAVMDSCEVVPARIARLLVPLRALIGTLSIKREVPQVELAIGDDVDVLVLRVLRSPALQDEVLLREFADNHRVQLWLQPKGPETAFPFYPLSAPPLSYRLDESRVEIRFRPTDFTQINHAINPILIRHALALLDPEPGERIGDLFCGLGNFTLPVARRSAFVTGVDGSAELLARAAANAELNGLADRVRFLQANLFETTREKLATFGSFDKLLIDPPRDGALAVVQALEGGPSRIVYVSCSPATLARDAGILVNVKGYRLRAAGIVNMFPHTSHVESIALFTRERCEVDPPKREGRP